MSDKRTLVIIGSISVMAIAIIFVVLLELVFPDSIWIVYRISLFLSPILFVAALYFSVTYIYKRIKKKQEKQEN